MAETIVRGGTILSMDPDIGDLDSGDILIGGDTIRRIDRRIEAEGAQVIDAAGMIVIPGLVDAHLHTWQTGIRGIAGDWTLFEYGRNMHAGLATAFTPDDIYIANLVGALNQINAGVTTLFDWNHNNPTPAHTDRAIDGLEEAGIRAVYGHGTPKPKLDDRGVPTSALPHPEEEVARLRAERIPEGDHKITLALCIRGTDLATYEDTARDLKLARKYGAFASAHLGGRMPFNRKAPDGILKLAEAGLFGPDFNSVHSNKLSDRELEVMAKAGVSFTITPEVEMQMGHGLPVTGRLAKLGVAPSIGIDVESNIGTELLWAARFALQLQRGLDNIAVNEAGDEVSALSFTTRQALQWVTIEGARALRLEHRIGSLTPGKQADITMIRATDLNLFASSNPAEAVLYQSNSANVDTVMVAGEVLKRGGRLAYADLEARKEELAASGRRILNDAARVAAAR